MTGRLLKDASGRNSYEIAEADQAQIFMIANMLRARFGFESIAAPAFGLDQVLIECSRPGATILVGWDIWSGCFVTTRDPACDPLVAEIGAYLDGVLRRRDEG